MELYGESLCRLKIHRSLKIIVGYESNFKNYDKLAYLVQHTAGFLSRKDLPRSLLFF